MRAVSFCNSTDLRASGVPDDVMRGRSLDKDADALEP